MMAADRTHHHPHLGDDPRAATPSAGDSPACQILDRRQLIGEVITLVLCGPSALIVLVLVARHGWPPWWLVIAGMLIAWAGDALWTVGDHTVGAALAGRAATLDATHRAGTTELTARRVAALDVGPSGQHGRGITHEPRGSERAGRHG